MRYLFFDIECAEGNMAICEFGYVICDERFQVFRQFNMLINPESKFNLIGRPGQKDLILSYDYKEYKKHPTFKEVYSDIKYLMTQDDLVIFGHGAENDIRFLIKDCKRYGLKPFDFVVYDIQKMLPVFSKKNKKYTSLEKAYIELVPEETRKGLIDHRACDDALMTMLVFSAMLKDLEFSVSDMIEACPKARIGALEYWERYKAEAPLRKERREAKRLAMENKAKRAEGRALWSEVCLSHEQKLEDANSIGKFVTVSSKMKEHKTELNSLIDLVKNKGYVAVEKIGGSDYFVVFDENDKEEVSGKLKYPYGGKIITLKEFAANNGGALC